jgi:TPR repeat protein
MQEVSDSPSREQDHFSSANRGSTRMPADQDNAEVQFMHGTSLEQDLETPRGLTLAAECYTLSADQGHARNQCNYGICLVNGRGVGHDLRLGAEISNLLSI